ncbi:MAG: paraquat-inducible protein A [Granulosicoccaceae bacterium]
MCKTDGTHINHDGNLGVTALQAGLAPCIACGTLHKWPTEASCRRCGGVVRSRKPFSLQRTWAFLLVGILTYIPANILPIMDTLSFTGNTSDTILTGVAALFADGGYFVAFIVFVASVCIPLIKFVVIGGLALSLHFHWAMSESTRQHLHVITEFIGRWSMIDVFVVAVLAALIQLGAVIKVVPGPGINWFALSVVFTMLSATSLDPRLIWDNRSDGA